MNVQPLSLSSFVSRNVRIETGEMARSRNGSRNLKMNETFTISQLFVSFESRGRRTFPTSVGNASSPKSERNLASRRETASERRIRVAMAGAKTPCVAMMFAVTRGAAALRRRARRTARTRIKQVQLRIVRRPSLPLSLPLDYTAPPARCSFFRKVTTCGVRCRPRYAS